MSNHGLKSTIFSSNRHGGVSHSPYNSFNVSYRVGDTLSTVTENRDRLKNHLSINFLLSACQVHGDNIFIGNTPLIGDMEVDEYDALMTNIPGIGLMIQQADCQAVTLFDPVHAAIAAIHCGWKGSVLNILSKTIQLMNSQYKSLPSELHAAVSPSLGPCCAEFINHELELPPSFLPFQVQKNHFDFWQITTTQLRAAGVKEKNITTAGICTSCSNDYFSYRRSCRNGNGITGRCATIIAL